ncbi:hypothetical protein MLD38_028427 [Melastoma candidum]|uniref:Uncharacterized protein n=1 Tax=Melastoma candidum TaxID=119954 RepID=A0ACB9N5D4_9MYRT|nr:hypothetical protein MLD38_028427 [Melastoma candidum]
MPVEMPRRLPFSVDTWTASSLRKRHRFLTHAHRDHSVGILKYSSFPLYCTPLTRTLLLHQFPQLDEKLFVGIEVGQSLVLDDLDGSFTVTALDANHCPGAVMFLFEGEFGNILHTGDSRLTPECLQNLPEKYFARRGCDPKCRLDFVYLDCTFGKYYQSIPSKHSAIRQVINCIWNHPNAPVVYLTCDLLGQEDILAEISRTFGSKIYVDKAAHRQCHLALTLTFPDIISDDASSRFHLFSAFPRLQDRAQAMILEAQENSWPEPLIIRPSTQWYACEEVYSKSDVKLRQRFDAAVKGQSGIWHVCYSIHSSRDELEWALQLLVPKWVVSTTPNCWAMDLDYVKRNCFVSKIAADDPLWNLLDIESQTPINTDVAVEDVDFDPVFSTQSTSYPEVEEIENPTATRSELVSLSPPSKRVSLTLFGRARVGLENSIYFHKEKEQMVSRELHLEREIKVHFQEPVQKEVNDVTSNKVEPGNLNQQNVEAMIKYDDGMRGKKDEHDDEVKQAQSLDQTVAERSECLHAPKKKVEDVVSAKDGMVTNEYGDNVIRNEVEDQIIEVTGTRLDSTGSGTCECQYYSPSETERRLGDGLIGLFRSRRVPVPRPLPSLVELNASRRYKRAFFRRNKPGGVET